MKTKTVAIIAAILLVIAIPPIWPYGYYRLLRFAITAIAIFIAFKAHKLAQTGWMWTMIFVAILFNPIFPIYLDKGPWVVIDIIVATIFLATIKLKDSVEREVNR